MYGPTVLITTLVDSAIALREAGSLESARSSGTSACSAPSPARTASSLDWLRPASAHLVGDPARPSAWPARYSAVSAPVKPVAPNRTISCSRASAIRRHPPRRLECPLWGDPGLRGDPARHRRGDPLRRMGRLARQIQER